MRWKVIIVLVAGFLALHWVMRVRSDRQPVATPSNLDWMTDASAALARARSDHRMVLMNFTGSDWCGWCIKLDQEVFSTAEFESYARQNLVLLKVDFPRQTPQSAAEREQNEELAQKYNVTGFPTIVILRPDGREKGRLGYRPGGSGPWLAALKSMP